MNTTNLVTVIAAFILALPATAAYLSARRISREHAKDRADRAAQTVVEQVYGQAYDRAQRINNEIVNGLRDELARLKQELHEVRSQTVVAELRNVELERKLGAMELSVGRMEALLEQHGIDPPGRHE